MSKRIVVVGGVAGGMSFAARARRLDESAEIIVFERGPYPSFANCGLPYFVSGEIAEESSLLVQTPQSLRAALNIDVRVEHEVVAVDTDRRVVKVARPQDCDGFEFDYDELVLAPGAISPVPDYGVIDATRAHTVRTVPDAVELERIASAGGTAVIVGGGYIGVETAEALTLRGMTVHIVQRSAHALSGLEVELAHYVTAELTSHGISIHAETEVVHAVSARDAVTLTLTDGTTITADHVIFATGARPATGFVPSSVAKTASGHIIVDDFGRTSAEHVWAVGDAVTHIDPVTGTPHAVALAGPANRDARYLADAMLGVPRPRPAAIGTAITRVFGLTAATVGANSRTLDAAGVAYETIHLHASSHAGYFPGAENVHLVAYFATQGEQRGRLYGAQAVGRDGVDKRIDVIATAIRAGLTIDQLADLDLAYAPPYGSAKDPVQMLGFVGQNVLDGTTTLWQAKDLRAVQESSLILDVRRPDEYAAGHLHGALNIAHTELRERLDEVIAAAAGRPVRIHCAAGVRSYLAHRILVAAGLDSATLSGGMQTLIAYHGKEILTHEEH